MIFSEIERDSLLIKEFQMKKEDYKEDYIESLVRDVIKEHLFEHRFPHPSIPPFLNGDKLKGEKS